jgi:hypothetical protein
VRFKWPTYIGEQGRSDCRFPCDPARLFFKVVPTVKRGCRPREKKLWVSVGGCLQFAEAARKRMSHSGPRPHFL